MRLLGFGRHPVSEEDLSACVDGRLSARAQERVDAHIKTCADCGRKLEEMRSLVAEMRMLPEAKAPRSFALSPELAAATRREGDRARQEERATARRVYLGLSGATVAAAILLIAVVGSDMAFLSRGNGGQSSSSGATISLGREAASSPSDDNAQKGAIAESGGQEKDGVIPGVAPPLPSAAATDRDFSANTTPSPAPTPYGAAVAAPQQATPAAEESSHLWLWIVEGAAGGLLIGFGASAFWVRRRWVQVNRD